MSKALKDQALSTASCCNDEQLPLFAEKERAKDRLLEIENWFSSAWITLRFNDECFNLFFRHWFSNVTENFVLKRARGTARISEYASRLLF